MKLFIGLGNPGGAYARHRHNVGFMALDRIAEEHGFGPWKKKFQGLATDGYIDGARVLLLKPQTYMNESGRSVGEAARFLKIGEENLVVFYDEIDLAPGKLKIKTGGGNAGHNGLRSISAHFGNEYQRVRIGIGHPGVKELVARWVLSDFAKVDADWLDPLLEAIAKSAGRLAKGDAARFLTDVARRASAADAPTDDGPKRKKKECKERTGEEDNAEEHAIQRPAGDQTAPDSHKKRTKSGSALAESLKSWLSRRKGDG